MSMAIVGEVQLRAVTSYIDLDGNKKVLIKSSPEKKQVSKRKLFIKNDKIHFDFVKYSDQSGHSYWPDSLNLAVVFKQ